MLDYIKLDRVLVLKGPRRTGKSTLMFQMVQELLDGGVASKNILYLPFDDPELDFPFDNLILEYEKQLGREIGNGKPVYCFFDEIQQFENWSGYLKKYVDKKWPVKFIVSGSSASLIKTGAESLAGRTVEEIILPFSFFEFLLFNSSPREIDILKEMRRGLDIFSSQIPESLPPIERKITIHFEKYATNGGFPGLFSIDSDLLRKKLLREDIVEKAIYRDLVTRYGVKKPLVLEQLFLYLVNQSSDILNIASISNSLKLSREKAQDYVEYLREAYLILTTPRFAPTVESEIRAKPKMHAIDPGFITTFSQLPIGKRIESIIARNLFPYIQTYYRNRTEVDIIIRDGSKILPIEVKYSEQIRRENLKGIQTFMRKYPCDKAIVVTKHLAETQENIQFIPAHIFLALV